MSASEVYNSHLNWQLGKDAHFTEQAFYDPTGLNTELWGIFVDDESADESGTDHVSKKNNYKKFLLYSAPVFDIYDQKKLYIVSKNKTYTIQQMEPDNHSGVILYIS